jgi:hypothetical protein
MWEYQAWQIRLLYYVYTIADLNVSHYAKDRRQVSSELHHGMLCHPSQRSEFVTPQLLIAEIFYQSPLASRT